MFHHLLFFVAFLISANANAIQTHVVYGQDNRVDYFAATGPQQRLADATVALMRASVLTPEAGQLFAIKSVPYGPAKSLCQTEPFYSQETAAFCSGFLVAPDLVVTAGHCVRSAESCASTRFVFGFREEAAGAQPRTVSQSQVFNCAELIHSVSRVDAEDFAVIRLDRPVPFVAPLNLRRSGSPAVGDGLTVMGHPSGLPLKIADGANVRMVAETFLRANLDTYGGNSGSAVVNNNGEVEGVLVRGERDFVYQNGCYTSYTCPDGECRGEDVTLMKMVLPFLQR